MSCRTLAQPLFVEALVSGYGNGGGFLDWIEKAFDRPPLLESKHVGHGAQLAKRKCMTSPSATT
jgi:hypothetical protein